MIFSILISYKGTGIKHKITLNWIESNDEKMFKEHHHVDNQMKADKMVLLENGINWDEILCLNWVRIKAK